MLHESQGNVLSVRLRMKRQPWILLYTVPVTGRRLIFCFIMGNLELWEATTSHVRHLSGLAHFAVVVSD